MAGGKTSGSNVDAALRFLRRKGLSPAQAAGVVGSMQGESGPNLDPAAENPTSHALGIGQWLGGRKTAAVQTRQLGPQLSHLWHELNTSERAALSALKGAHTPEAAAVAWQKAYERGAPFEQKYSMRAANARKLLGAAKGAGGGAAPASASGLKITGKVTPSTNAPSFQAAAESVLRSGSKHGLPKLGTSRLAQANQLFRSGLATAPTDTKVSERIQTLHGTKGADPAANVGKGNFVVFGQDPGRLKPELIAFARKVAAQSGETLRGDSGASHSRLTINGNVSEHSTGNATDIPAKGTRLLHLGQAALVAAGMPEAEARKAKGGLYNVGRHQIIFLTNEGGNHFDHLHISTHAS